MTIMRAATPLIERKMGAPGLDSETGEETLLHLNKSICSRQMLIERGEA